MESVTDLHQDLYPGIKGLLSTHTPNLLENPKLLSSLKTSLLRALFQGVQANIHLSHLEKGLVSLLTLHQKGQELLHSLKLLPHQFLCLINLRKRTVLICSASALKLLIILLHYRLNLPKGLNLNLKDPTG